MWRNFVIPADNGLNMCVARGPGVSFSLIPEPQTVPLFSMKSVAKEAHRFYQPRLLDKTILDIT
jgi:hypothetical protein